MLDQTLRYIGENTAFTAVTAGSVFLLLLLFILLQVVRTRCEAHKICKKIQGYLDVVFAEDEVTAKEETPINKEDNPCCQTAKESAVTQKEQKDAEDARLLMDVISEIF